MLHQWLVDGTGNANYFFAVGVAYCSALSILTCDVVSSYERRAYAVTHGLKGTPDATW